ncbi:MAG: hypothetical protein KKF80_03860, partial [Candidatus Omnitrophica bacterium]|nr:hypothetical protein [Candidatus Omnitrophota bacterium]
EKLGNELADGDSMWCNDPFNEKDIRLLSRHSNSQGITRIDRADVEKGYRPKNWVSTQSVTIIETEMKQNPYRLFAYRMGGCSGVALRGIRKGKDVLIFFHMSTSQIGLLERLVDELLRMGIRDISGMLLTRRDVELSHAVAARVQAINSKRNLALKIRTRPYPSTGDTDMIVMQEGIVTVTYDTKSVQNEHVYQPVNLEVYVWPDLARGIDPNKNPVNLLDLLEGEEGFPYLDEESDLIGRILSKIRKVSSQGSRLNTPGVRRNTVHNDKASSPGRRVSSPNVQTLKEEIDRIVSEEFGGDLTKIWDYYSAEHYPEPRGFAGYHILVFCVAADSSLRERCTYDDIAHADIFKGRHWNVRSLINVARSRRYVTTMQKRGNLAVYRINKKGLLLVRRFLKRYVQTVSTSGAEGEKTGESQGRSRANSPAGSSSPGESQIIHTIEQVKRFCEEAGEVNFDYPDVGGTEENGKVSSPAPLEQLIGKMISPDLDYRFRAIAAYRISSTGLASESEFINPLLGTLNAALQHGEWSLEFALIELVAKHLAAIEQPAIRYLLLGNLSETLIKSDYNPLVRMAAGKGIIDVLELMDDSRSLQMLSADVFSEEEVLAKDDIRRGIESLIRAAARDLGDFFPSQKKIVVRLAGSIRNTLSGRCPAVLAAYIPQLQRAVGDYLEGGFGQQGNATVLLEKMDVFIWDFLDLLEQTSLEGLIKPQQLTKDTIDLYLKLHHLAIFEQSSSASSPASQSHQSPGHKVTSGREAAGSPTNDKRYTNDDIRKMKETAPRDSLMHIEPIWVSPALTFQDEGDIDKNIELPLRAAVKIFFRKRIRTTYSSANIKNLLGIMSFFDRLYSPGYESNVKDIAEAREKKYAQLNLDYDDLSSENKTIADEFIGGKRRHRDFSFIKSPPLVSNILTRARHPSIFIILIPVTSNTSWQEVSAEAESIAKVFKKQVASSPAERINIYDNQILKRGIIVKENLVFRGVPGQKILPVREVSELSEKERQGVIAEFEKYWPEYQVSDIGPENSLLLADVARCLRRTDYKQYFQQVRPLRRIYFSFSKNSYEPQLSVESFIVIEEQKDGTDALVWLEKRPSNKQDKNSFFIGAGRQLLRYVINITRNKNIAIRSNLKMIIILRREELKTGLLRPAESEFYLRKASEKTIKILQEDAKRGDEGAQKILKQLGVTSSSVSSSSSGSQRFLDSKLDRLGGRYLSMSIMPREVRRQVRPVTDKEMRSIALSMGILKAISPQDYSLLLTLVKKRRIQTVVTANRQALASALETLGYIPKHDSSYSKQKGAIILSCKVSGVMNYIIMIAEDEFRLPAYLFDIVLHEMIGHVARYENPGERKWSDYNCIEARASFQEMKGLQEALRRKEEILILAASSRDISQHDLAWIARALNREDLSRLIPAAREIRDAHLRKLAGRLESGDLRQAAEGEGKASSAGQVNEQLLMSFILARFPNIPRERLEAIFRLFVVVKPRRRAGYRHHFYSCSGIIWNECSDNYYVVTAGHAFDNQPDYINLEGSFGTLSSSRFYSRCSRRRLQKPPVLISDKGLVRLTNKGLKKKKIEPLAKFIRYSRRNFPRLDQKQGVDVFILGRQDKGNNGNNEIIFAKAKRIFRSGVIEIDTMVPPGFSGAPVVNENGYVIGIVRENFNGKSYADDAESIKRFISDVEGAVAGSPVPAGSSGVGYSRNMIVQRLQSLKGKAIFIVDARLVQKTDKEMNAFSRKADRWQKISRFLAQGPKTLAQIRQFADNVGENIEIIDNDLKEWVRLKLACHRQGTFMLKEEAWRIMQRRLLEQFIWGLQELKAAKAQRRGRSEEPAHIKAIKNNFKALFRRAGFAQPLFIVAAAVGIAEAHLCVRNRLEQADSGIKAGLIVNFDASMFRTTVKLFGQTEKVPVLYIDGQLGAAELKTLDLIAKFPESLTPLAVRKPRLMRQEQLARNKQSTEQQIMAVLSDTADRAMSVSEIVDRCGLSSGMVRKCLERLLGRRPNPLQSLQVSGKGKTWFYYLEQPTGAGQSTAFRRSSSPSSVRAHRPQGSRVVNLNATELSRARSSFGVYFYTLLSVLRLPLIFDWHLILMKDVFRKYEYTKQPRSIFYKPFLVFYKIIGFVSIYYIVFSLLPLENTMVAILFFLPLSLNIIYLTGHYFSMFSSLLFQKSERIARLAHSFSQYRKPYFDKSSQERADYLLEDLRKEAVEKGDFELSEVLSYVKGVRIVPVTHAVDRRYVHDVVKGEVFIHARMTNHPGLIRYLII